MVVIAENIRQAEQPHFGDKRLHRRGRDLGNRQRPASQLLDIVPFGPQHAAGDDLDAGGSVGFFRQPLGHIDHPLMHGMRRVQPVGQTQGDDTTIVGSGITHIKRKATHSDHQPYHNPDK